MFNFVTCVENCQVYQLSLFNKIEPTDKNNYLCFGMILASTDNSCISWFVVNTYTTERARDRPFSFLGTQRKGMQDQYRHADVSSQ